MILATSEIEEAQIQPASLDLRLGTRGLSNASKLSPRAWHDGLCITREIEAIDEIKLADGAVLENGLRLSL